MAEVIPFFLKVIQRKRGNMKFYGSGVVWDSFTQKRLCRFVDGVYDTEDSTIINRLVALGYPYNEQINIQTLVDPEPVYIDGLKDEPIVAMFDFDNMLTHELKRKGKEYGIKSYGSMKRETLIAALKEKEGKQ
jgi:hypothetical protein